MACLYLVPNTLDLGCSPSPLESVLPQAVMAQAAQLRHWIAEDAKSARALLKRIGEHSPLAVPLQEMAIAVLPRAPKGRADAAAQAQHRQAMEQLLAPLKAGHAVGLVSEAGLPGVADPGAEVVAGAHRLGVPVMPLSGPNSLMLALAASGLHGQSFAFVGYLPQEDSARAQRLRELEQRSRREGQTQILIETPYRNAAVLTALLQHLAPATRVSVACGLTVAGGWCRTLTVQQWRAQTPSFEKHLPAVFCFLA